MPFLSIVTRNHPRRPNLLERCKASIEKQTDKDFQHVILYDEEGLGIPYANQMFSNNRHLMTGEYVFILDDDDVLIVDNFVEDMKQVAKEHGDPGIIFIRMLINGSLYPSKEVWEKDKMIANHVGSSCSVVLNKLWQENIEYFVTTETPGDFNFIDAVFSRNPTVYWQDKVYSEASCLSRGGAENESEISIEIDTILA